MVYKGKTGAEHGKEIQTSVEKFLKKKSLKAKKVPKPLKVWKGTYKDVVKGLLKTGLKTALKATPIARIASLFISKPLK